MYKLSPHVKYVMIPTHILGIAAVWYLIVHFAWWMIPTIWLGWFVTGCLGTEIGLHRLYSHKAFLIKSKAMSWFMAWAACMGAQWSPVFWAALHRGYHHPHCDTPKDLHSPVHGLWHAYMGWYFTLKDTDVRLSYARDLVRDPVHQFFHKHYLRIFWISCAVLFAVLGVKLFLLMVILPMLLAQHQENLVNLLCHVGTPLGYRNFEISDRSVNIYPLGLLIWGQGFHNNHHAKPNRYDFGTKLFEIDICRWVVPALVWIDEFMLKLTYG